MTLWCLLLASTACSTDAIPTAPSGPEQNRLVATVSIRPGDLVIAPDETFNLAAVVQSARGRVVNGRPVTWTSSDESVARIDQLGNVLAGREGTATIRANVEGTVGTATIDVRGEVVSIEIDAPETAFSEGSHLDLRGTYVYRNGARRPAGSLRWLVLDPDRLLVDGHGRVRGLRPGFASVKGQGRGSGGTLKLKVEETDESSVTLSAGEVLMSVGDTVRLWADVEDKNGNRLTRKIKWSSSAPGVAEVDGEGLVKAISLGDAAIYAQSGDLIDSTMVAVEDGGGSTAGASASLPRTVSDLGIATSHTTYNSVTLRFTEVDDGTGSPADYVVRYMGSPIEWSEAMNVTKGTCAVPLAGTSIGATRTCTVEGLQASTSYDFRVVAYRGTLGEDAVYGALSNVATETTPEAPTVVDVVPSSFQIEIAQTKQLEATVTDAYGNPVDATVSWSSSNSSVATVNGSGLVTGQGAGDATIRAKADGDTDASAATVTSPITTVESSDGSTSAGSHEPSGFVTVTARNFDALDEDGWSHWLDEGDYRIASDATAPSSPSNVGQMVFTTQAFSGSYRPAVAFKNGWEGSDVYLHMWFRVSENWYGHPSSGTNKVFYLTDNTSANGGDPLVFRVGGIGDGTLTWGFVRQNPDLTPSARKYDWKSTDNELTASESDTEIVRGRWHLVEVLIIGNTPGRADGELHTWLDGKKVFQFTGQEFLSPGSDGTFDSIRWEPIWGGSGDTIPYEMHQTIDYLYISTR